MPTQKAAQLAQNLQISLTQELPNLTALTETESQTRLGAGPGWSRKQELGHLLDSATNNRVRFANAALAGSYTGPTYDGDGWVMLGGYQSMPWATLIQLWATQNQALATLIGNIPDSQLESPCLIGPGPTVTLEFLIDDYILHMQHHLDHILGRATLTSYPGAALGV